MEKYIVNAILKYLESHPDILEKVFDKVAELLMTKLVGALGKVGQ